MRMTTTARRLAVTSFAAIALLAALYALVGFLVLPALVERELPRQAQERLGVVASVSDVDFNPFLLAFTADDVRVDGAAGKPMLAARRLHADLSWSSLWRRGWRFDRIAVDAPVIDLRRERDGRLNLAKFGGGQSQSRGNAGSLPDLYVGELRVRRGSVAFTDHTRPMPETHQLRWVDIELDRLATRQDARGDLLATAVLPRGGALATRARIGLQPLAAAGALRVRNLGAAVPWSLLHGRNGALARGRLDLDLDYDFSLREHAPALRLSRIGLRAEGLALHEQGNGPTPPLAVQRVVLRDGRFDLQRRELTIPELRLGDGALRTVVESDGTLNWQRLFGASSGAREPTPAPAFAMTVERLVVEDVALDYIDHSRAQPLQVAAAALDGAAAFTLRLGPRMHFAGKAAALAGRDFVIRAAGTRDPPALASTTIALSNASFDFAQRLVQLPQVRLDRGALRFDTGRDGQLNWQRLFASRPGAQEAVPADATPPAGDPRGWRILLPDLRASALGLALTDLSRARPLAVAARAVDGSLDLSITPGAPGGTVALDAIRLAGRAVTVGEAGAREEPALRIDALRTSGGHFRGQDLLLSGLTARGGSLLVLVDAQGAMNWTQLTAARATPRKAASASTASAAPWRVRLPGVRAEQIGVRYRDASRALPLEIAASRAGASLDLAMDGTAGGGLRIARLQARADAFTLGAAGAPPVLTLAQVQAEGGELRGNALRVARVRLADGGLALAVAEDGTIDAQQLFAGRGAAPSAPRTRTARDAQQFALRLPRVEIAQLRVAGSDRSRAAPLAFQAAALNGTLGVNAGADGVQLHDAALRADALALTRVPAKDTLLRLASLGIDGGALDTRRRSLAARTLTLRGGALALVRGADGEVELLRVLGLPQASTQPAPAATSGSKSTSEPGPTREAAWRYRIGEVQLESIRLALSDLGFEAPIAYGLTLDGSLRGLDSVAAAGGTVAMRAGIDPAGSASVTGNLPGTSQPLKLRVMADGVPLQPLQPALARYAALALKSGALGADAVLSTGKDEAAGALRISGSAHVDALRLDEAKTGDRFLAWKRLQAQSINLDVQGRRLVIGQALLDGAQARLEISREGQLNLKRVLRDTGSSNGGEAARASNEASAHGAQPAFVALVDRLRIRDGSLRFADRSLVLPFVADITQFNGTVVSLSTRPQDRAELHVDGRVQPFGAARARGSIRLAEPRSFTDIRAEFNNVPLPKLSPYTITFAGRAVAEGRLWLDLQYRIVEGTLIGENQITMQDLRLGERVAAPRARDLPLELAAALLTDEQGVMSLRVPVRGDLDNPSFDYKTVIRAAISNTLRKAVTAPFRFIGRLFGPDVEELDAIEFEPGSASLRPPEQEKLNVVAQSLAERPRLGLEVQGSWSAEEDARALRAIGLEGALAQGMKLELGEGERIGPIAFGQSATQLVLERLFAAQFGADAAEALRARVAREAKGGREVRRVDRDAGDPIAAAGDPDLYRAMFERLVERQPLDAGALPRLAAQRTQAVLDYIVRQAGVPEQRLEVAPAEAVRAKEELVPTRLRLQALGTGKDIPVRLETVDKPQPEEMEAAAANAQAPSAAGAQADAR